MIIDPLEIEDILQNDNVFLNGISGRPSHMDSYMTIIDYVVLEKSLDKIILTTDQWNEMIIYWEGNSYLSPNASQLASYMKRKLDITLNNML